VTPSIQGNEDERVWRSAFGAIRRRISKNPFTVGRRLRRAQSSRSARGVGASSSAQTERLD
jgi:hypothetical protein